MTITTCAGCQRQWRNTLESPTMTILIGIIVGVIAAETYDLIRETIGQEPDTNA